MPISTSPAFSILIPHQNIPHLLERCLSSIPKRPDLEVLVIDDHSDSSLIPTIEKLEKTYAPWQFVYLTGEGRGAGHARNIGLDLAKGEWILLSDADDFFVEDFAEILDTYKNATADILYFRNRSVMSENTETPSHRDDWTNELIDQYKVTHDETAIRCNHCVPWGKMIRAGFIKEQHLRFDEVMYATDVMFGVLSGCKANSVMVIDKELYVLTERDGSLTFNFGKKPDELKTRMDVCIRAHGYINQLGEPFVSRFHTPLARLLSLSFQTDKKLYSEYFDKILEIYPSYLKALKQIRRYLGSRKDKRMLYLYSAVLLTKGLRLSTPMIKSNSRQ